jgi:hypothetical protein
VEQPRRRNQKIRLPHRSDYLSRLSLPISFWDCWGDAGFLNI